MVSKITDITAIGNVITNKNKIRIVFVTLLTNLQDALAKT